MVFNKDNCRFFGESNGMYGKKHKEATKKQFSIIRKEDYASGKRKVTIKKAQIKAWQGLSKRMSGKNNPNYNGKITRRADIKIKIIKTILETGCHSLEKNGRWSGGKSFEPYGLGFNYNLKETIRKRDNHTCQECGLQKNNMKLDIHHIDYEKTNHKQNNLISLCRKCHSKTNSNKRYWRDKYSRNHRR